ncbi:MAG: UDP-glucuronosyltransferase [Nitrososphaerota archaeon]|nr:UDP-glucuronosyltransferase [Nitrososphaerota archaeon]MDG7026048.1 UDP-glucuronosyltransferase [Nitrososphaerota archaeon]
MPRILYGVSPIGLGHATRSLVVARELERMGGEVRMFSGGKAAEFLRGCGARVDDIVDDAGPKLVGGEMKNAAAWYVRSWLAQRRNVPNALRLAAAFAPDVVVCDEEFSGAVAARELGIRRALIADELELGFARGLIARAIERRVETWYRGLLASVDALIVPEEGEDVGNRRYVGPIVRARTAQCPEVRSRYGLPQGPLVLVSLSGSGAGRELASKALEALGSVPGTRPSLAVAGNRGPKMQGEGVYDLGVVKDNQDLVACADLVVSTAGKSTIDEAASAGTPIIAVPIRNHAEQERNAAALGYSARDWSRLGELIPMKMAAREEPRHYQGEVRAADIIMSLA